jgi:hypothetical protein
MCQSLTTYYKLWRTKSRWTFEKNWKNVKAKDDTQLAGLMPGIAASPSVLACEPRAGHCPGWVSVMPTFVGLHH